MLSFRAVAGWLRRVAELPCSGGGGSGPMLSLPNGLGSFPYAHGVPPKRPSGLPYRLGSFSYVLGGFPYGLYETTAPQSVIVARSHIGVCSGEDEEGLIECSIQLPSHASEDSWKHFTPVGGTINGPHLQSQDVASTLPNLSERQPTYAS